MRGVAAATGTRGHNEGCEGLTAPLGKLDSAHSQGSHLLRGDVWPALRKAE